MLAFHLWCPLWRAVGKTLISCWMLWYNRTRIGTEGEQDLPCYHQRG